ncbi:MAG: RNA polymerase sigma factor [Betaproteobacteria bacterium]
MILPAAPALSEHWSDTELTGRIARHDLHAFEVLMRRHNQLLYRTARGILRDDHEAEDCVQEAYLQAYRAIGSFRSEAKLSTWLVRIVINQALEKLRKRKKEDANVPLDNVVDIESRIDAESALGNETERPEAAAIRAQLRRLLETKIDRLPDAFRTVFILRALEEMSVEETAACLGIAEATVRTRFFRARSLLRETILRDIDIAVEGAFAFDGARCDRIVANVLRRINDPPG